MCPPSCASRIPPFRGRRPGLTSGDTRRTRAISGFYKFGVLVWETDTLLRNPPIGSSAQTQEPDRQFPVASTGGVTALAIAPEASRVAIATEGTITIVEPQLQEIDYGVQPGGPLTDPMTGISGEAGLSRVRWIGTETGLGQWQSARALGPRSGCSDREATPASLPDGAMASQPPGLAFARGGRVVAWSSQEPAVGIWDAATGPRTLPISQGFVDYDPVALSTDGSQVVAAGSEGVQVWDLAASSGPVRVPSRSSGTLADSVRTLEPASSSDSMFAVWDSGRIDRLSLGALELQPLVAPSDAGYTGAVAFAPDASLALQVTEEGMSQIDLATGRRSIGPELGLPTISAIALSRDGQLLAAADGEESVVLWDMQSGEAIRRFAVGRIARLALSPDARLMAGVTGEGFMSVWDVGSGTKLGEFQLREGENALSSDRGYETTLRFSPDGDLLDRDGGGQSSSAGPCRHRPGRRASARRSIARSRRASGTATSEPAVPRSSHARVAESQISGRAGALGRAVAATADQTDRCLPE